MARDNAAAFGCKSATFKEVVGTGLVLVEDTLSALIALKLKVPVVPLLIGGETYATGARETSMRNSK